MNNQSDKKIIKQVKQGDVSAYAILVDRYRNMAFTLALSVAKNNEDAEEIAQDSFVKVYKNLHSFQGRSKFSTWLYQIVYRTALSKMRIKKVNMQSIDEKEIFNDKLKHNQPETLERLDRKKIIKMAISKLTDDEGFLLILYYYQELSMEELAKLTGYSVSNVKVKLHRARKNMYEHLQAMMNGQAKSLIQL